jgi:hypothetical protein
MKGNKMTNQKNMGGGAADEEKHGEHAINIQIDRIHYKVKQKMMTGAELRQLPATPIAADRDLFQVVPGGSDHKIGDADLVELRDGARFFTAPGQINPGFSNAC